MTTCHYRCRSCHTPWAFALAQEEERVRHCPFCGSQDVSPDVNMVLGTSDPDAVQKAAKKGFHSSPYEESQE